MQLPAEQAKEVLEVMRRGWKVYRDEQDRFSH